METDLELLRYVFTFHMIDAIVHADENIDPMEIDWVVARYPREELFARGMIDENNALTVRYRDLLADALYRLPSELPTEDKVELIQTFFATALADGEFESREGQMIVAAAELLGLPVNEVHERLPDLGELELDD